MRPRNLVDVLAALPEDELRRLRALNVKELERLREELKRLKVEAQQIKEAAERRAAAGPM